MPRSSKKYIGSTQKRKREVGIRKNRKTKTKTQKGGKNCHPGVVGKTVVQGSCLTPPLLEEIKREYNRRVSAGEKIAETEPSRIYQLLHQKIKAKCRGENCWSKALLKKLESESLKTKMLQVEAPRHPKEWDTNPREWLSNFDIDKVMKQYEETYPDFLFLSPSPIDFDSRNGGSCVSPEICQLNLSDLFSRRVPKRKIGMVFNLSKSTEPGTHWVSLYLHFPSIGSASTGSSSTGSSLFGLLGGSTSSEEEEEGGKPKCNQLAKNHLVEWDEKTPYAFFFDSTGEEIPVEIEQLVCRLSLQWEKIKTDAGVMEMQYDDNHRTKAEHQKGNTECGMYSLFFLVTMLSGFCGGKVTQQVALKKPEVCPADLMLDGEQEKREYFQSQGKWNGKMIPDSFVAQFRDVYFNDS